MKWFVEIYLASCEREMHKQTRLALASSTAIFGHGIGRIEAETRSPDKLKWVTRRFF